MANLSSPPSPASSEMSKLGLNLNPTSPLYLYQIEQLKMLHQRSQGLSDLSTLLYQNPSTIQQIQLYTANPALWWQQLIFSLPPAFGNNLKRGGENFKPESSPSNSPRRNETSLLSRDYILTPETPEHDRDESFEMEIDEQPLNLSKKDHHHHHHHQRETDISSSSLPPMTPKINSNLFSAIWSPASLVSSAGFKSESVESSPTTPKLKFNFENIRGLSVKRENSSQCDYATSMRKKSDIFMNNNNLLTFNNNLNLNATFNGIENVTSEKSLKVARKSLPMVKPDSTEHSDYVVHEYRDERGKKERTFEVKYNR